MKFLLWLGFWLLWAGVVIAVIVWTLSHSIELASVAPDRSSFVRTVDDAGSMPDLDQRSSKAKFRFLIYWDLHVRKCRLEAPRQHLRSAAVALPWQVSTRAMCLRT